MLNFTDEKQPAFFRMMSPELFFEAESMETDLVMDNLAGEADVNSELDALLAKGIDGT